MGSNELYHESTRYLGDVLASMALGMIILILIQGVI